MAIVSVNDQVSNRWKPVAGELCYHVDYKNSPYLVTCVHEVTGDCDLVSLGTGCRLIGTSLETFHRYTNDRAITLSNP